MFVVSPLFLFPQQISNTNGSCSPISPFNQGVIEIRCTVSSPKQASELLEMMNKILENQTEPRKQIEDQRARDACSNSLAVLQATDRRVQIIGKWLLPREGQEELKQIHVNLKATMIEFAKPSDVVENQKKASPKK
jgi:hypothetical protein